MKIGIDIDDTITDTYYKVLEYISKEKNIDFETLKEKNYNYDELYDGVDYPPMGEFIWNNFYKIIPTIEVKKDAVKIMEKIINDGHEIILITARSHAKPNQTEEYLKEKRVPYNKFFECIHDKGKLAKEENIDLFIDDSINNCSQVLRNNINVLLFDAPYNKNCNDYNRVCNWKEVYEYIEKNK